MQTTDLRRTRFMLSLLCLLSGLSLLPLLAIGSFFGIDQLWFDYVFLSHSAIHCLAIITAMLYLLRLLIRAEQVRWFWWLAFTLVIAALLQLGRLPITNPEALSDTLAFPKWWLAGNNIFQVKWHPAAYQPQLLQLGYLGLLKFNLSFLCSWYHLSFLFLAGAVAAAFTAYKTSSFEQALLSWFFILSTPLCMRFAGIPVVDCALLLYIGLAICSALYWVESKKRSASYLLFTGLAAGLAMSVRYNGVFAVCLLLPCLLVIFARQRLRFWDLAGVLTIVSFSALAVFGIWALRNAYWTLNPLYPLFRPLLGGPLEQASGIAEISLEAVRQRQLLFEEDWIDIVLMPLRFFIFGQDGELEQFNGVLTPILLFCMAALVHLRQAWILGCGLFLISYCYLSILFIPVHLQHYLPLAVPTSILACYGVNLAHSVLKGTWRKALVPGVAFLQALFAAFYLHNFSKAQNAWAFWQSSKEYTQYLTEQIPSYSMIEDVNTRLSQRDSLILLYVPGFYYYYDIPVRGQSDPAAMLASWFKRCSSVDDLLAEFRYLGSTYLLAEEQQIERYFERNSDELSPGSKLLWTSFAQKHLETVKYSGRFVLSKLKY